MPRARRRVRRSDEPRSREAAATTNGLATGDGPTRLVPWLLGVLAAIGLVISVALVLPVTDQAILNAPSGPATTIGRVAALAGTYLLLITLLLIGRIPLIERVVGQDKLVRVHRWFGPAILALLGVHVVAITVGYAQQVQAGPLREFWVMIVSYPGMLMAATAMGLLIMVAASSYRRARQKMRYETWWIVHLYAYIAAALSFTHQLSNGVPFIDHPIARGYWIALWAFTAGAVIFYRWAVPIARSIYHRLRVVAIEEEAPGVVSVIMRGRHIDRLPASGGQYLQWRFLSRGMWWMAHPYSLSALPTADTVRITVKQRGPHSTWVASLQPGTRVAIEGPYGAFTHRVRHTDRVLLVAAGVGATPVRAMLEDLPRHVDVVAILRGSRPADLVLRDEIAELVDVRGGQLHEVIGSRAQAPLDEAALRRLVPDIAQRDVYMCGPRPFTHSLRSAVRAVGVPPKRIHREDFVF
ncbi:MAG TPA: ferredoxin reductase family protein [Thermoleophilia bacterium]|nr:ferredoxin reductase family protein [Thermoleophilia bacterium]